MPPPTIVPSAAPRIGSRDVQPISTGSNEPRRRGGGSSAAPAGACQADEAVAAHVELAPDRGECGASVTQRQPGPIREIALARRSVTSEIAARELCQRSVTIDGTLLAEPVADEHPRVPLPDHRPAHAMPLRQASMRTCTNAWPSVDTFAARTRSRSSARVSGPSAATARSTAATPRSAAAGETPSCASRRALPVKSGGVVSACSHG